jgi:hypothetical protein
MTRTGPVELGHCSLCRFSLARGEAAALVRTRQSTLQPNPATGAFRVFISCAHLDFANQLDTALDGSAIA